MLEIALLTLKEEIPKILIALIVAMLAMKKMLLKEEMLTLLLLPMRIDEILLQKMMAPESMKE